MLVVCVCMGAVRCEVVRVHFFGVRIAGEHACSAASYARGTRRGVSPGELPV